MPNMNPKSVKVNNFLDASGNYLGTISKHVLDLQKGSVRYQVNTPYGGTSIFVNLDPNGNPKDARANELMLRLLRAAEYPQPYTPGDGDSPFDYDFGDVINAEIYFEMRWSKPNSRYPEAKLWMQGIRSANSQSLGPIGPDGLQKPAPMKIDLSETESPF